MNINPKFGLRETPQDPRDFKLGNVFKLPLLEDLPHEFSFDPLEIKDQGDTDFCTAYATDAVSELQEGKTLEPSYTFALSKKISGDPEKWGQNIRVAMQSHQQYGALPEGESPYNIRNKDENFLRYLANWPKELLAKALPQHKQSFFAVTGPYDAFNNIRAAIWLFQKEKRGVAFGTLWNWSLHEEVIPDVVPTTGSGHSLAVVGWKWINGVVHLKVQNSYGKEAGENGYVYFPQGVVNTMVARYGAFMFVDMPPEEAKQKNEENKPVDPTKPTEPKSPEEPQKTLLEQIVVLIKAILKYFKLI